MVIAVVGIGAVIAVVVVGLVVAVATTTIRRNGEKEEKDVFIDNSSMLINIIVTLVILNDGIILVLT